MKALAGSVEGLCLTGPQRPGEDCFFHMVYLHWGETETEIHTAYPISYPRKKGRARRKVIPYKHNSVSEYYFLTGYS